MKPEPRPKAKITCQRCDGSGECRHQGKRLYCNVCYGAGKINEEDAPAPDPGGGTTLIGIILILALMTGAFYILAKLTPLAVNPDPPQSEQARKQALYEEPKAAEPSPDQWQTQPESARRAVEFLKSQTTEKPEK